MARKPRIPESDGKPKGHRISGYQITIKGWLAVEKNSLASQKAIIDLLTEAEDGDLTEMVKMMTEVEFTQKLITRTVPVVTTPLFDE